MISANELRIGNYVLFANVEGFVCAITEEHISFEGIEMWHCDGYYEFQLIDKIPLTEEWLFKFRFVDVYDTERHWLNKIQLDQIGMAFYYNGILIKYVHQLQNLYFALTGHELKIKNSVTT